MVLPQGTITAAHGATERYGYDSLGRLIYYSDFRRGNAEQI